METVSGMRMKSRMVPRLRRIRTDRQKNRNGAQTSASDKT